MADATVPELIEAMKAAVDLNRCERGEACTHDGVCRIHKIRWCLDNPAAAVERDRKLFGREEASHG